MSTPAPLPAPASGAAAPRHLVHVLPTFAVGGIQVRLATLINHFGPRYRHTILALDGRTQCADRLTGAAAVTLLAPPPAAAGLGVRARQIWATLGRLAPELLLTYNWGAIEWAAVNGLRRLLGRGCPLVHSEDGFGADEADRRKPRRNGCRRLVLAGADLVLVPSATLAAIAGREWGVPTHRLRRLDNGVDLSRFATAASDHRPAGAAIRVGTVAPLRPEKNLGRLLRAFAAIESPQLLTLVIAGDGSERPALEAEAARLGLSGRVRFLGAVAAPERVLADLEIFAISSDTEQQPTTVIEAMAAGLPVVGVAVGDIATMVAPPNRPLIVPRADEAGLSQAIARLAGDGPLRQRLGAANRAEARRRFGDGQMFGAYQAVFELGRAGANQPRAAHS